MIAETIALGALAAVAAWDAVRRAAAAPGRYPVVSTDPGVDAGHAPGALPCPRNPPPPAGFVYWPAGRSVPAAVSAWASKALGAYPVGTIVQDRVGADVVTARVEWHTWQGATGATGGCYKGVSLFVPAA